MNVIINGIKFLVSYKKFLNVFHLELEKLEQAKSNEDLINLSKSFSNLTVVADSLKKSLLSCIKEVDSENIYSFAEKTFISFDYSLKALSILCFEKTIDDFNNSFVFSDCSIKIVNKIHKEINVDDEFSALLNPFLRFSLSVNSIIEKFKVKKLKIEDKDISDDFYNNVVNNFNNIKRLLNLNNEDEIVKTYVEISIMSELAQILFLSGKKELSENILHNCFNLNKEIAFIEFGEKNLKSTIFMDKDFKTFAQKITSVYS